MQTAKKVASNTLIQYVQLALNVLIGLYSVRVILRSLGTTDYGIYDLMAGVIGLLSFISNSLAQTSIRFIAVSMGKDSTQEVQKTFNSCFVLHLLMAIALVLILELLGLFLFKGFLNIPSDRIPTAKIIYQCMLVTLFINVIITPLRAIIIAHEKFIYTSFVGIMDSLCKLGVAFLVAASSSDKLRLYGWLMMCITIANFFCYFGFCLIKYRDEVRFKRVTLCSLKDVCSFAGWTLLDVLGSVINRQGYAIMLNKFFGTGVNAVFALARQVEGHMYSISTSATVTMKPQIMKSFGKGDTSRMLRLSLTSGKIGFSMMSLIAIPLLVMMPGVLHLWLGDVPDGTVIFTRLLVIACMISQLTQGLFYANQAIGNVKWFSIIVSTLRILALPVSCLFLLIGHKAVVAIIIFLVFETLGSFSRIIILSKISDLKVGDFFQSVFLQILPPFAVATLLCMLLDFYLQGGWGMLANTAVTAATYAVLLYFIGLTKEEKASIDQVIKSIIAKIVRRK